MSEALSKKYWECSKEWLEHNKTAHFMEEMKSATLSQMMMKQGDVPVSKAEMLVKASEEWAEYIKLMCASRASANEAKCKIEFIRMKAAEQQSAEATARLEMKL